MHRTRMKIKDEFIAEIGINPRYYDKKRGVAPPYGQDEYEYDEFDMIITKTTNELLRAKKSKQTRKYKSEGQESMLDVFWYLYACFSVKETSEMVLKRNKNNKLEPIKEDTVKRYEREVIKLVKNQSIPFQNILLNFLPKSSLIFVRIFLFLQKALYFHKQ